jgi:hypothetical protein
MYVIEVDWNVVSTQETIADVYTVCQTPSSSRAYKLLRRFIRNLYIDILGMYTANNSQ